MCSALLWPGSPLSPKLREDSDSSSKAGERICPANLPSLGIIVPTSRSALFLASRRYMHYIFHKEHKLVPIDAILLWHVPILKLTCNGLLNAPQCSSPPKIRLQKRGTGRAIWQNAPVESCADHMMQRVRSRECGLLVNSIISAPALSLASAAFQRPSCARVVTEQRPVRGPLGWGAVASSVRVRADYLRGWRHLSYTTPTWSE
ncbi:uncharacterized protein THITE_2113440 [Thermothielavioides terrestris NRRL 8126]|uniref:Uncharacterized protein n=1 Tax=Thermothielavioides terrestris (strain ATCC 38088 / NRRL 8126) TaxID=578455 RepID=G2R2V9_THETT|nr:uncharacterized protein THITE_2113440 [Thermothielavioides terrestris NRRL 8126]AEO65875.1 hypothetical protein THITE_2113440 [Thermothielavioides terrestris NRRL 8126]